mmetsp:Transcript_15906/g.43967  ORF Transcript_15906/g.43967 Transcript_15906/m.43967 type:complete len:208 (-) Transcript_15906:600-1223(-)
MDKSRGRGEDHPTCQTITAMENVAEPDSRRICATNRCVRHLRMQECNARTIHPNTPPCMLQVDTFRSIRPHPSAISTDRRIPRDMFPPTHLHPSATEPKIIISSKPPFHLANSSRKWRISNSSKPHRRHKGMPNRPCRNAGRHRVGCDKRCRLCSEEANPATAPIHHRLRHPCRTTANRKMSNKQRDAARCQALDTLPHLLVASRRG